MKIVPDTIFLLVAAMPAMGGRPLTTEDASIQQEKACQVESWVDRSREATQSWFVPACNFGANIEWGGTRAERFVSLGVFWQSGRFLP